MLTSATHEPDLFDFLPEIAAQRAERDADPLVCLRDEVPTALEAVVHLSYWRTGDDTGTSISQGRYAYTVCRAGLRYERKGELRGWGRPQHLLTWGDLAHRIGDDPRRADVIAWAGSLTAPDRWRDLRRPFELWPRPEMWHPDYITGDHERAGWGDRIAAWRTAQAILTDAIGQVTAGGS